MIPTVINHEGHKDRAVLFQFGTADAVNLQQAFRGLRQIRSHFGERRSEKVTKGGTLAASASSLRLRSRISNSCGSLCEDVSSWS